MRIKNFELHKKVVLVENNQGTGVDAEIGPKTRPMTLEKVDIILT